MVSTQMHKAFVGAEGDEFKAWPTQAEDMLIGNHRRKEDGSVT